MRTNMQTHNSSRRAGTVTTRGISSLVLLLLAASAPAATITHTNQVDDLDLNLQSMPTTATASFSVAPLSGGSPVTWNIGSFSQSDQGKRITITSGPFWQQMQTYLLGDSIVSETVDAGPLYAHTSYQFPLPAWHDYPQRTALLSLQFELSSFVTEVYQGAKQGYVAGTFSMQFQTIPEPATLLLVIVSAQITLLIRTRKAGAR